MIKSTEATSSTPEDAVNADASEESPEAADLSDRGRAVGGGPGTPGKGIVSESNPRMTVRS